MKYEYKYLELHLSKKEGAFLHDLKTGTVTAISHNVNNYGPGLVDAFDKLGASGWELTGFAMGSVYVYEYIFKRQID